MTVNYRLVACHSVSHRRSKTLRDGHLVQDEDRNDAGPIPDWSPFSRRAFLSRYAGGIGSLALSHLMAERAQAETSPAGWPAVTQAGRTPKNQGAYASPLRNASLLAA